MFGLSRRTFIGTACGSALSQAAGSVPSVAWGGQDVRLAEIDAVCARIDRLWQLERQLWDHEDARGSSLSEAHEEQFGAADDRIGNAMWREGDDLDRIGDDLHSGGDPTWDDVALRCRIVEVWLKADCGHGSSADHAVTELLRSVRSALGMPPSAAPRPREICCIGDLLELVGADRLAARLGVGRAEIAGCEREGKFPEAWRDRVRREIERTGVPAHGFFLGECVDHTIVSRR